VWGTEERGDDKVGEARDHPVARESYKFLLVSCCAAKQKKLLRVSEEDDNYRLSIVVQILPNEDTTCCWHA
jgi:hypothetical protein